jgi:hypothetical protein
LQVIEGQFFDPLLPLFQDLEGYRDVWMRYDTKGSFVVPSHNLLAILQQLPAPLGTAGRELPLAQMLALLARLDIPDHAGQIQTTPGRSTLLRR